MVRLSGGFWNFRRAMKDPRQPPWRRRWLGRIYDVYLKRYGAYIGHAGEFAGEPCFPHNLIAIFIVGNARIGKNCVLFQQVTIGANAIAGSRSTGAPTIGDNAYIGAGAKIIGASPSAITAASVRTASSPATSRRTPWWCWMHRVLTREQRMDNRNFRWSPQGPEHFDDGRWILEQDPAVVERLRGAF